MDWKRSVNSKMVLVPRVVSIADCGRVVSPRTAESQMRGGVVWGIGTALREETGVDPRYGGWLNNDLADYVVVGSVKNLGKVACRSRVDQPG